MRSRLRHVPALLLVMLLAAACTAIGGDPVFGGPGGVTSCDGASPRPGIDENGCWHIPDYFAVPPEVVPSVDETAATVVIDGSGSPPEWIEGGIFFVRAVSTSGEVVLEQRFDWPGSEVQIPPGYYQVTLYARSCDANCDYLAPPTFSCTVDLIAEPSRTFTIDYHLETPASYTSSYDLTSACEVDR